MANKTAETINKLISNWRARNISGVYCRDTQEAVLRILNLIPLNAAVGISGSITLEQLGIVKHLEGRGNKVFNQYKEGIDREESISIRMQGAQADYYLASANAISESGELVFLSAFANRILGVSGAKNLIVVCGINKITKDITQALSRARNQATVLNCKRLDWNTPCLKEERCHQEVCLFPEYKRMCCQLLVVEADINPDRVKVVLIDEELGF